MYWKGLESCEILIQTCQACGHRFFYSRLHCPSCWSNEVDWSPAAGPFRLHTFTVSRVPTLPEFFDEMPQCLAVVELEPGVRVNSALRDVSVDSLEIGQDLRPVFIRRGGKTLLYFTHPQSTLPALIDEDQREPESQTSVSTDVGAPPRVEIHYKDVAQLRSLVDAGFTDWSNSVRVDQELVNSFADLSGDDYWIHTDPERARNESPFGGTIAHGALVQVLISRMRIPFRHEVVGFQSMVNYGSNKLRFPSPVPVGSEIHARARVAAVDPLPKGTQVTLEMQTFVKGFDRPSVINEIVVLYM
jgi:acyl dehydratase/uncharacterized OB-fold protein